MIHYIVEWEFIDIVENARYAFEMGKPPSQINAG